MVHKKHLRNCRTLKADSETIELLKHMKQASIEELSKRSNGGKFKLGFHRSFATSIDHLHLHAWEYPFKSRMEQWVKTGWWFRLDIDILIANLERDFKQIKKHSPTSPIKSYEKTKSL